MNPFVARTLDRMVIQLACRSVRIRPEFPARAEEARAQLSRPDFFAASAGAPSDFRLRDGDNFDFTSPVVTPFAENNRVRGKLFRGAHSGPACPTLILLHGWNAEWGYAHVFPKIARRLVGRGINTALLELPYHAQRRPLRPAPVRDFISEDLASMVEATRQAVADIRALLHWLKLNGAPRVAVCGFSLGAWLAGLVACFEPDLDAAALVTPVVQLDRIIRDLPFCAPIRQSLSKHPLALDQLSLLSHQPGIEPEKLLLIESIYDVFVPPETVEELWRAWRRPEIWRVPLGHISVWFSTRLFQRLEQWMADRLCGELV